MMHGLLALTLVPSSVKCCESVNGDRPLGQLSCHVISCWLVSMSRDEYWTCFQKFGACGVEKSQFSYYLQLCDGRQSMASLSSAQTKSMEDALINERSNQLLAVTKIFSS